VRGNVYKALGSSDSAINDYTKAIGLPGLGTADLANAYVWRGSAHYTKAEYNLAMSDYNKAIRLAPSLAAAYADRGSVYNALGSYDSAITDYTKAIGLPGLGTADLAKVYAGRGDVYYSTGSYDSAISSLRAKCLREVSRFVRRELG